MIKLELTKEQIENIIDTFDYCEYDGVDFDEEEKKLIEILKKVLTENE